MRVVVRGQLKEYLSYKFSDSQLSSARDLLKKFADASEQYLKGTTYPNDDATSIIFSTVGFGPLEEARSAVAESKNELEMRINKFNETLSVPRASSIEDFFKRAEAKNINQFLSYYPKYESKFISIYEAGESESGKINGHPVNLRPPVMG